MRVFLIVFLIGFCEAIAARDALRDKPPGTKRAAPGVPLFGVARGHFDRGERGRDLATILRWPGRIRPQLGRQGVARAPGC
jgi:hypothetical protein